MAELRLIKGITDSTIQRLTPYTTVYPTQGDGWINVNTADPVVIQALDSRISGAAAMELIQGRPFRTPQDVDRIGSFESLGSALRSLDSYRVFSDSFSIHLTVTVNDVMKASHAIVRRAGATGDMSLVYFRFE